ncbi:MAG: amidohydrolase family protein [Clostridia bacterium]|nr:amidohydrolase family protein [Clostridia bacterium]
MKNLADIHVHMSEPEYEKCEKFLDLMAEQDVTDLALQALSYHSVAYNVAMLYWKNTYKKIRIAAFGMPHNLDFYRNIPFELQAKALIDMGCDGIKLMFDPGTRKKLGYGINDERYDKMFTYLEENDVPVLIHVNDPEEYWIPRELSETAKQRGWGYFEEGFLSKQEIYDETFEMLDRHPRLRVTFAHFFFLSNFIDEATRVMETYPNVNFDLTPGWEMYLGFSKDIDAWQAFFEKYSDRILYGTDCNNYKDINPQIHQLVRMGISHDKTEFIMPAYRALPIKGLDLSEETLDKIIHKNYVKFVGEPKPVDMATVCAAAHRVITDIGDSEDEALVKAQDALIQILEHM